MASRTPLTILIGSGLSEGLHLPGTAQLTEVVRKGGGLDVGGDIPVMQRRIGRLTMAEAMWRMATSYYEKPNFETMLHLAETALGYSQVHGWLSADDRAKPAFGAFMNVMPHWRNIVEGESTYSMRTFITAALASIAESLVRAADALSLQSIDKVRDFLTELSNRYQLTIATLNYDDILERAMKQWRDGFIGEADQNTFDPAQLLATGDVPLLMHLHGSVRFFVQNDGKNAGAICRAQDGSYPLQLGPREPLIQFAQSGEPIVTGPMISGLRKTDKLSVPPFGYYHWRLHDAMMRSPNLLVIGYGGYDTYLTELIVEMRRIHGSALRIAFIVRRRPGTLPTDDWGPLLPAAFIRERVDAHDWLAELDEYIETDELIGNALCKVYVDGFPVKPDVTLKLLHHFS
jgi:hypothetical protein